MSKVGARTAREILDSRGKRLVKYNQLLRIKEELGVNALLKGNLSR
jgi:enolase